MPEYLAPGVYIEELPGPALWAAVRLRIEDFLLGVWKSGGLMGRRAGRGVLCPVRQHDDDAKRRGLGAVHRDRRTRAGSAGGIRHIANHGTDEFHLTRSPYTRGRPLVSGVRSFQMPDGESVTATHAAG